jgi:hypothetical protein
VIVHTSVFIFIIAISTKDEDESSPPPISSAPPSSPPPDDPVSDAPSSPPKKPKAKPSSPPKKIGKADKSSKKGTAKVTPNPSLPPLEKVKIEGEEEAEAISDDDLVDEEGASKRKNKEVASKTAELALAKMEDVDFGWKDGET